MEGDFDGEEQVVRQFVLTRKHVLVFYGNGRVEWLNKYYPEAMEEERLEFRPFYMDKYFETKKPILSASYDPQFTKIFITFA